MTDVFTREGFMKFATSGRVYPEDYEPELPRQDKVSELAAKQFKFAVNRLYGFIGGIDNVSGHLLPKANYSRALRQRSTFPTRFNAIGEPLLARMVVFDDPTSSEAGWYVQMAGDFRPNPDNLTVLARFKHRELEIAETGQTIVLDVGMNPEEVAAVEGLRRELMLIVDEHQRNANYHNGAQSFVG